ncbi:MAG: sulfotransferase [Planctomycetota bacterium]
MNLGGDRNSVLARAQQLAGAGKFVDAINTLEQIRRIDPQAAARDAELQHLAGFCLMNVGQIQPAEMCFKYAIEADPARARTRVDYATMLRREGRTDDALAQLDAAIASEPDSDLAARSKAALLMDLGRYADAGDLLGPIADRYEASPATDHGPALVFARHALSGGDRERALRLLDRALTAGGLPVMASRIIHRRRGELLDKMGRYDDAFAAFVRSHEGVSEPWDADAFSRRVDEVIRAWTPDAAWRVPKAAALEGGPAFVFIVGMPRSGTSLVEQVLASLPGVFAAGERHEIRQIATQIEKPARGERAMLLHPEWLRESTLTSAASHYAGRLDATRQAFRLGTPTHVTDKMPYNFFYLPLIARMLPGAKVIRCTRDPIDTCLSNYFQTFAGTHPHIHDLKDLGAFHRDHDRLMAHWLTIAPDLGLEITEASYEKVVADFETEARRLVAFAGLPWSDDALSFHTNARAARTASNDQVRRPIYTSSVNRRERYARHLGPLREGLGLPDQGSGDDSRD